MVSLPPALAGDPFTLASAAGVLSLYAGLPHHAAAEERPLLLIHSINAAASAAEMRPVFEHYRRQRPTYAIDLPGYGGSDRSRRVYSPRLMTDAVHALVGEVQRRHGATPVDAVALSLGCEYLARAAHEAPAAFRTAALLSPTGFNRSEPFAGPPGSSRGSSRVHRYLAAPWLGGRLFRGLTRPGVIRYFLQRTWGAKQIDEALWAYDVLSTREPGAEHAPLYFLSGLLFSADISTVYQSLALPVWMVHGVRGDFVDYRYQAALDGKTNWSFTVMPTGAMPHFEQPDDFFRRYDAFLALARVG